jgi:hypothetical protein
VKLRLRPDVFLVYERVWALPWPSVRVTFDIDVDACSHLVDSFLPSKSTAQRYARV